MLVKPLAHTVCEPRADIVPILRDRLALALLQVIERLEDAVLNHKLVASGGVPRLTGETSDDLDPIRCGSAELALGELGPSGHVRVVD
jgi:hypothetical protein